MPLQLYVQINILIYSLLAGLLIGVLFDLYRTLRGHGIHRIIIWVEDILFWILSAIIVFSFLLFMNYAFLGPYVYLFIVISIMIYFKYISAYFLYIEKKIITIIIIAIRITIKSILYPIKIFLLKFRKKNKTWIKLTWIKSLLCLKWNYTIEIRGAINEEKDYN